MAKKNCNGLFVLESAIAGSEYPAIGVHKGDQLLRLWARSGHGLRIGEEIVLAESD